MEPIIYGSEVLSPAGSIRLACTDRGACALVLPGVVNPKEKVARLMALARPGPADHPILQQLIEACSRYFGGEPDALEGQPVDFSFVTEFQARVLEAARTIPPGMVRPYGWVARKVGNPKSARAVGGALAANPVPLIVPCHRVVAANGSLGGFTGGIAWKRRLLAIEGEISGHSLKKSQITP